MKDFFRVVDDWNSRFNIFRDYLYLQKLVLVFVSISILLWIVLGWDSGLGMITLKGIDWSKYGKTFHFSAFVIYGLLYYGLSKHLQKIHILHTRNVFYSASLVLLNISIFEHFYCLTFAYFQRYETNLLNSYLANFPFFWSQYLLMAILGFLSFLGVIAEAKPHFNFKIAILILITFGCCLFWIFYPLPIETVRLGDWENSRFFPQTRYSNRVYIRNALLHLVNVVTKAMFAFTQLYIIRRFKK